MTSACGPNNLGGSATVLLAAAYFIFMAPEVTLIDTPSCNLEVTEVHSGVLFDLLVVLTVMLDVVASPWGGRDLSVSQL